MKVATKVFERAVGRAEKLGVEKVVLLVEMLAS